MAVKVFVSSTYIDLKDHRQRVIAQLRRAGYHVDPMEDWTSDANEPRLFSLDRLDGCQACVLLVGFRRGFVPAGQERSITQMEYHHAIDRQIDVLPFLLDDGVTGWPERYDDRTTDPPLNAWREYLGLHHGVERFTADPTSIDVLPAFSRWQARQYTREQTEAAGFTPAGQLQLNHITVGGDLTVHEVTIQQYFGDTHRSDPASRNRRAMIEKVWAIWITGVLQPSLPHDILLELGLTERPAMVTRALDLLVQPDLADRVQMPGTPLIDVFDRLDRALLMLGAPGAGKTTLLLTLARDLLQRAAQDPEQPIPVVFPLSSWAARRRPLAAWLVDELQQRYDVPRKISEAWVDADQVLPLLDGLDEVQAEHRTACADAINTFRQDHGLLPLAVCSRITEYEALGVQLRLQGAIVVQPLTRAQVNDYLTQIGEPLAAVRQVLQDDPLMWELLDTPLMLTIVTLAYAGQPAEALRAPGTLVERRQSLFTAYVNRMFQRRSAVTRYTREQTERWLAWLAWQLTQHSQTVFFLERLQPDWLPVGRRWLPTQGARLLAALVGLLAGPLVGLFGGLGFGLGGGLIAALIGGLTGYSQEITPIETVRWSWSKFLSELFLPSRRSLRGGLLVGLLVGLAYGLLAGLGALFGWLAAPVGGLGFAPLGGLLAGLLYKLSTGLGGGLFVGLATGIRYGGRPCLQHLVLRLSLRYYDCIPRHYADFLDYAVERLFLDRVGGGYIFIHRLLQEYFATMYQPDRGDSPPQPPPPPP
jgi:hypothetical protein